MNRTMAVATLVLAFIFQIATMTLPPVTQVWPTESNPATYGYYYQSTAWVAVNPFDQDVLYVYAEGKIFKSDNGGQSWDEIGNGLPDRAVFTDTMVYPCPLAFSPFDETGNTFILGTERLGVSGIPYMTEDGGETFFPINICEKGPGHSNLNFRYGSSTWGAFSNKDSNYMFLSVLGEVGGQPVFMGDYDKGTNSMSVLQNSMFPTLTGSCPSTTLSTTCLNSNNPGCWQYGSNPCYWGGEMRLTVLPNSNDYFESEVVHTDYYYSACYTRTQYKMFDSTENRHCLIDNVFFDMDYFGSPYPDSERYWHINAPVFYSGENTTFYTVIPQVLKYSACPSGNPPVGDMERIYFDDEYETHPLLAKCDGLDGNGDWIFTTVDNGELPQSCLGNIRWIKKNGNYLFISTGKQDNFLAYNLSSKTWITFSDIKIDHFELINLENNQVGVLYMKRYAGSGGIYHTELRLLTFNTLTCQYSDTLKEDFTGTFTGLSEYHVFAGNSTPWRDTSNHKNIFVADDNVAAYFSGNEFKILTRQNNQWTALSTSYLENFYYSSSCDLCTANFTSIAVKDVGESGKWGYLSSDAGIWRNKEIGTEDNDGTVIVPAFEQISGGYCCNCYAGCWNEIPNTNFGNYAYKVVLGPVVENEQTLYTATKSGLWKGCEATGGGNVAWTNVFDPTDHNEKKTEVYDVLIGDGFVFAVSEGGIWRSRDDETWEKIYDVSISGGPVSSLAKYADCASRIICAAGSYIYASSDSGTNWYAIADVTSTQAPIKKIEFVEEDDLYMAYFLTNDGILNKTVAFGDSACSTLSFTIDSASSCDVDLSWTNDQNALSYDILRASDGVSFETLASDLVTTSYQDSTAIGGKSYYYAIRVNYSDPCDSYECVTSEVSVPSDYSVSSVSPATGSWAGGTSVKLTGTGLDCSCNVYFGANLATNCATDVDGIWVTSPASSICLNPHTVTIKVTDSCNEITAGSGFEYYWNMAISPSTLPGGTLGTQYSQQQISTSGGVAPYSYSVTSGSLPAGLTLLSTGYLMGVPSVVGGFDFTVTSTDSCGISENVEYLINIAMGDPSQVLAWGNNAYTNYGCGTEQTCVAAPIPLEIADISDMTSIAGGYPHTLGIKDDGSAWAWGDNTYGELGIGYADSSVHGSPLHVQWAPGEELSHIVDLQGNGAGEPTYYPMHSIAVDEYGRVWAWGDNTFGQLGIGTTSTFPESYAVMNTTLSGVTAVNCGWFQSIALDSDGDVWAWGDNSAGQLGDGGVLPYSATPVQVDDLESITAVSAGSGHFLALDPTGVVWGWGWNDNGQVLSGGTSCYYGFNAICSPIQITGLAGITRIAAGFFHSMALDDQGTVWTWGDNTYGQLGRGQGQASTPSQVKYYDAQSSQYEVLENVVSIVSGLYHCLALKEDGTLWAWGDNSSGQLGDGTYTNSYYAIPVSGGIKSISSIYAVGSTSFARLSFFSPEVLPKGTAGTSYSQTISASFGKATYEYEWTDGTLPAGMGLSEYGVLSGTPLETGTFTFTVKATDSDVPANTMSREYTLVIESACSTLSSWAKTYGSTICMDDAYSIQQTTDGGYIVAGLRTAPDDPWYYDIWILKLDAAGVIEWQRSYGSSTNDDYPWKILQTADGGYVVGAVTFSYGAGWTDFWVLKLDSNGNILWEKTYGTNLHDSLNSIELTSDGGYILSGSTSSHLGGNYQQDLWIIKLNSTGGVDWQKKMGGSGNEIGYSVQQTTDGGYIVAGSTSSYGAGQDDYWILKLDSSGNISWQKTYGGVNSDSAVGIQQTSDGGFIVGGNSWSLGTYRHMVILKLDSSGNVSWQNKYAGSANDSITSLQKTTDGGYIVGGISASSDMWVLKLASDGTISWQKAYGHQSDYDGAYSVRQTSDGGYVVAGSTSNNGEEPYDEFLVLKLDSSGNIGTSCDLSSTTTVSPSTTSFSSAVSTVSDTTTSVSPANSSASVVVTDVIDKLLCSSASCSAMSLSPSTLPNGSTQSAYNQAMTATGGTSPYCYAIASGTLPAGLAMTYQGVISGSPTVVETNSFTITATDSNGCTESKRYSLAVTE